MSRNFRYLLILACAFFLPGFAVKAQNVLVGDQVIESNIDTIALGVAEAFPATAAATGQVGSINLFLDASSTATKIYVGIYADSSGVPGTLLTQGSSTQLSAGTWNTIIVSTVSITAGKPYWIAILGTTSGKPEFRDRTTNNCQSRTSSQSNLTSLPSSWTTGKTWGTCYISAYAVSGTYAAKVLIGNQAVEASLDKNPAGRAEAFPAAANITGTVATIALYLDSTSGSGPVYVGLYANNNGHPGTLLGQGSTTKPVAGNWNQIAISPSNITAGQQYWIAVLGTQATSPYFRDRQSASCHSETTPQSTLTSLPATWTTGTIWNTCYISAYGLPSTASPVLSLSTGTLSFSAIQGGANPAPANLSVTNTGTGTLNFTVSTDASWLSAAPVSGTAPQTVQVSAATGTLTPNTYTGHVTVTASGAQGSPAVTTVTFTVAPLVPPSISAAASPVPNSTGWNNSSVTVTFTCAAGTYPLASCSAPKAVSGEGKNQSICGAAVDKSGLSAQACANVSLDETPPIIMATPSPASSGGGWNNTPVTVTFTCSDSLSGVATCPSPQTISAEGNHQVSGTAVDFAGNTASAQVPVKIDQTPPTISQFTAPAQIAPGQSGTATLTATDSLSGVTAVVFQLNGTTLATFNAPPYSVNFTAPTTATDGATLTLTVSVSDAAGNANSSSRGIQVVPDGVVTGQVLTDTSGLPLKGATVQIVGGGQGASDNNGRYSIPANTSHLFVSISVPANTSAGTPAMVTVEREVFLQIGVGTVPVDARMTAIAAASTVNSTGGSLTNGPVTIIVAPGAVPSATGFHLTSLTQQGLPGLLPLGWSPISAFDLRVDSSTAASFNATFTQLPSSLTMHLVQYDYGSHAWLMVTPNLSAVNGALTIPVPSVGDFALVSADAGNSAIVIPSAGQPLSGVAMVALPAGVTTSGSLNPPSVSPTGGTSIATLALQSPVPLPSGTVIQASVQETYTLTSGQRLSQANRLEDILVYQYSAPNGSAAVATFPVAPSRTFQPEQLSSGVVHLDILSGRESIRGLIGGSDAATVTGGDATLAVAAGSLPQDTAIAVAPEATDSFLPSTSSLIPLAEYNIDFAGQVLNAPVQLSVAAGAAQSGDNVFLVQVQRVSGVPYLVAVSLAQVSGTNLITKAVPGLSGITQGGDYVFYKVTSPTGYVSGTVTASSGPVAAIVQTDALPFVSFANSSGSFVIPAVAGTANLTATVPNTALSGTASIQVIGGQTAPANITVVGQVESATVTPPNGAVGVPLTAEIDITAPDAFNQTTVTAGSFSLTQSGAGAGTPIPVRFVFSQGGTRLSVFPQSALQPSTSYTFAASGIANVLGGLIAVPTTSFTTQANTPANFNTSALVFGMPDQNGNVQISAPANSFPPGTTILIVDQTDGVVLSLTVANDGSVTGKMPATIDDVLAVTITAPDKTTASFTRSQFVAPDGTTAIGPGGGTVTGPGNIGMIIPQGALPKGTTFKLALLDQTAFPQLPSWTGANFGSGIQITAPAMPSFNKEVKLAFPVPANAPPGAFYYVFRRLVDANDSTHVLFETIDHAFVQGTGDSAQVVTASPPFCGLMNSFGNFLAAANAGYQPIQRAITITFMMWEYDPNQAGIASQGLLVGNVFQSDPATGNPVPLSPGSTIAIALTNNPQYMTTTTDACGTYSLFDPQRGGGPRSLTATGTVTLTNPVTQQTTTQTQTIVATSDEVNGIQPDDVLFSVTAGLEQQYRNIGRLNFTFAPPTPLPPPPQIIIGISAPDANGKPQNISGIVQIGTPLTITFASTLSVVGATMNGAPIKGASIVSDTPPQNPAPGFAYTRLSITYKAGDPGAIPGLYTLVATAVNATNPSAGSITVSRSFLVVAAGGGNNYATANQAPAVIANTPSPNAQSVPTSIFPQITFNEPVVNVPANVTLVGSPAGDSPAMLLIGIKSDGSVANPVQAGDAITSLTIQPLTGLEFGETYTLTLSSAIVNVATDQNGKPIPQLSLPTFTLQFTTFGPKELGASASQYQVITRPVVLGQLAYAGEFVNSVTTGLGIFDVSDLASPKDDGVGPTFIGRGTDIAGLEQSPATGGALVAISASTAQDIALPGNVWLYSVPLQTKQLPLQPPTRVGAVSVTSSATQAGIAIRLAMKDKYLYASTLYQGLQVIDLQQAVTDYQQTNPGAFGQAVTTEGQGFAMDAIINDIQLPIASGGTATMFDLKADDFVTNSSVSSAATQTLLVATGQLPFVMADPTLSGQPAILYPAVVNGALSPAPLQVQVTNADGTKTPYQFMLGRAVAVGTIPVADSTGATTNKHIAVLVGSANTGSGSALVPLLVVVDVSQPYAPGQPFTPLPIGALPLPTNPTDVALNGSVALVATGTNVLLINLANPAQPTSAGQITGNFGNWLALTNSGILVASSPNTASGSLQTSIFKPTILIQPDAPILAKLISGDPSGKTQTPVFQLTSDVTLTAQLVPADPMIQQGMMTLVTANQTSQNPLAYSNSIAPLTLKAGTQITGNVITATATGLNADTGTIQGLPHNIALGTVQLVLDFNNDTVVDDNSDLPLKGKNVAAMWASDRTITGLPPRERLLDYFTVRVKSTVPWQAGTIQLQLASNFADEWFIADKLQPDKIYLQDAAASASQDVWVGQPCQFSANHPQNFGGECLNISLPNSNDPNNYNPQPLPNLSLGDNDYLFRCEQCPRQYPNVSAVANRTLQLVTFNPNGKVTVLDQANVDIRLLKEWATMYTVRSTPTPRTQDDFRPAAAAQLSSGWVDVQPDATNITVLVHGFHTSETSAEQNFVPTMMKRLYWVGQPVLDTKQNDAQGHAQVLGFAWPGDDIFPTVIAQSVDSVLFFPEDEMHALESGVPLAKLLASLKSSAPSRVLNVIAHSLGNMVVNSALSRPEMPASTVNKYIMYDAALPAEVFGPMFPTQSSLLTHAQFLGYNANSAQSDTRWQTEWNNLVAGIPHNFITDPNTGVIVDAGPDYTDRDHWCNEVTDPNNFAAPKPRYEVRWLQTRPAGGILDEALPTTASAPPCGVSADRPQRGPWQGFFAGNLQKANIINAYNTHDKIVRYAWKLMQLEQKPNYASKQVELANLGTYLLSFLASTIPPGVDIFSVFPTQADDPRSEAVWGDLPFTTPAENNVFGDGQTHSNVIRQWAELSQWYPSLTESIGIMSNFAATVGKGSNDDIPLDLYGNVLEPVTTHAFLYERSYPEVWPAFSLFKNRLQ